MDPRQLIQLLRVVAKVLKTRFPNLSVEDLLNIVADIVEELAKK